MYYKERIRKDGSIVYDFICSGHDPITRKSKPYRKTRELPSELIGKKKATDKFLSQCQIEIHTEIEQISKGAIVAPKGNIKFADFATAWVEEILKYRKLSRNYYLSCKQRLSTLIEGLGNVYLSEINPSVIKRFVKWLMDRTYTKEAATIKGDLAAILKAKKLSVAKVAKASDVADRTIFVGLKGERISVESATKLCSYLGVPLNMYFNIESEVMPYSSSSNKSVIRTLNAILNDAVKEQLIERNYASSDYTSSIKESVSQRKIFTLDEAKEFIQLANLEKDLRKRIAFLIYLYMGLRNSEVAGLEWQDINLDTGTLSVRRNCLYGGSEFGVYTKDPKTTDSARTICMPQDLINALKLYKDWWDKEKDWHADLWQHTDRLFVQNNGKNMVGSTLAGWLKKFEILHGLPHVTPHGLRHTNITMLISKGIDVKTVSGRVGHADVSTTLNIYSHFTKEADKLAANKIDELFAVN